jgi:hypothetical protein
LKLKTKAMKKKDLKTGMRALTESEGAYTVLLNTESGDILANSKGFNYLEYYDSDLIMAKDQDFNIIAVYGFENPIGDTLDFTKEGDLLWERKDEIKN